MFYDFLLGNTSYKQGQIEKLTYNSSRSIILDYENSISNCTIIFRLGNIADTRTYKDRRFEGSYDRVTRVHAFLGFLHR